MTSTPGNYGRLGNQIIRNLAVSLIAEKYNLNVNYYNRDLINKLGIDLFSGTNIYQTTQELSDNNYFSIYNNGSLNCNLTLTAHTSYFQTKDITNFLYDYLHTEKIKSSIIEKNQFKHLYNANNDLFIHIRLSDVARWNPGINYYLNTIKTINFDNLYISTDEKTHNIIEQITTKYPTAKIINYDEIATFQFASTCKNIILSHGSFSAIIGYLSFFSNIYYPEFEKNKIWHGDMFSIKNWIKMDIK